MTISFFIIGGYCWKMLVVRDDLCQLNNELSQVFPGHAVTCMRQFLSCFFNWHTGVCDF